MREVKTRKVHKCSKCGRTIQIGEKAKTFVPKYNKHIKTTRIYICYNCNIIKRTNSYIKKTNKFNKMSEYEKLNHLYSIGEISAKEYDDELNALISYGAFCEAEGIGQV